MLQETLKLRNIEGDDCGVFVMRYMDLWDGDWLKVSISQHDIEYIRHHMAVMAEENIARPWHLMDISYIDINDMRAYTGYYWYTEASPVIEWFWEVVQGSSDVDKARLLQFVTETSKVPLEGFSELQGLSAAQKIQFQPVRFAKLSIKRTFEREVAFRN